MANEISSRIASQTPPPAANSGQFATQSTEKVGGGGGQSVPATGNVLPQGPGSPSANSTQLKEAVSQINDYVQQVKRDISFSLDETSGETIIKVIDSDSGKLVRQIPSEEVLALATALQNGGTQSLGAENAPVGMLFSQSI